MELFVWFDLCVLLFATFRDCKKLYVRSFAAVFLRCGKNKELQVEVLNQLLFVNDTTYLRYSTLTRCFCDSFSSGRYIFIIY